MKNFQTARRALPPLLLALVVGGVIVALELTHQPAPPGQAPVIPTDATDDESRTLTLVWMGPPYYPSAHEGSWVERLLEREFNVDLKPVFLGYGQPTELKALMYAGGSAPDVSWEGDPTSVQQFAAQGFLAALPYELMLQYAPGYARMVNRFAPTAWLLPYWNGVNYGIPTMWLDGQHPVPGLWRMDWLRKVGITEVPETLDAMHAALKKFVEDDPDGNGLRDTYGMGAVMWHWCTFNEVYGAFGIAPFNWMERDGSAVWGGTLPAAKEALALLRQWYAEGLIHPDFVTDDPGMKRRKFMNGKIGYLATDGGYKDLDAANPNSLLSKLRVLCSAPEAELAPGRFPRGPRGERGAACWGGVGNIWVFGRQVVDHPEKVIRTLKILEATTMNDTLFVESKIGRRGIHWEYLNPALGTEGGIRYLPPYDQPQVAHREVLPGNPDLAGGGFFNLGNCGNPDSYNRYRSREEVNFLNTVQAPKYGLRDIFGKADVLPSSGRYLKALRDYQQAFFAQIIRGDRELDAFDEFVQGWYERGGALLTREADELLKVRGLIFAKMGVTRNPRPAQP